MKAWIYLVFFSICSGHQAQSHYMFFASSPQSVKRFISDSYFILHELPSFNLKSAPTIHLVTVGIGTYQQDYAFNSLEFTVSGAYSIKNLFERRNLTQQAVLLHDSGARRRDILSALETLTDPDNVAEDDLVIFYFSGHGLLAGGKAGICPYDYQSPADLIADEDIERILRRSPARHKVCLIEACKSTASADYLDPTSVAEFNRRRRNISPGIVFITSTEIGKKSWGSTEGYFTQAIMEALDTGKADRNDDRIITAKELFDYLQPAVKAKTQGDQVPQINSNYPADLEIMTLKMIQSASPTSSKPSATKPEASPLRTPTQPTENPCVTNQTGDLCVQNAKGEDIWVKIDGKVTPIRNGSQEYFYDLKADVLTFRVSNYQPGGGYYVPGGANDYQVKILTCRTATKVIR